MSDLIRREDATKAVYDLSDKLADEMLFVDAVIDTLENLPSAEPEQKGEWLDRHAYDNADYTIDEWQTAQCSVCGKYHTTPYMYNFTIYKYCPNCGTEMKRGDR